MPHFPSEKGRERTGRGATAQTSAPPPPSDSSDIHVQNPKILKTRVSSVVFSQLPFRRQFLSIPSPSRLPLASDRILGFASKSFIDLTVHSQLADDLATVCAALPRSLSTLRA